VLATVYFYFISTDCRWIQLFAIVLNFVAVFGSIFFLPESPKYFHCKKKWDELRQTLTIIAKFNGKPSFTGTFDKEVRGRRFNYLNTNNRIT
jgi:hypothetical protein